MHSDEYFMRLALAEAAKAAQLGEIPVGAVLVKDNEVIATAHNQTSGNNSPLGHAEKLVIENALADGEKYLYSYTLYVTLEPCIMCSGVIILSRIGRVVYGCTDPKAGAAGSLYHLLQDKRLNHRPEVTAGILETECASMLTSFFNSKR
ncbi:MAG: tRNA adenosine(34) deaminase TadA [Candidatus Cloacimonetes bacterium]|nr:tRNA adenosine(34) deaminase TadA [Candidatus Cloacimonadota bacterium]